jgi:uncharacterized protein (DUF486 family)
MGWNSILPAGMLFGSNLVMNTAWYGHLRTPGKALWLMVLMSWGLAFFEYCLAVPANRIGAKTFSLAELKTLQEVITLVTFMIVAWVLFGVKPGLSQLAGFALIAAGAALVFKAPLG